ncbi:MAG: response regulator [Polyangiaceae bacterium]
MRCHYWVRAKDEDDEPARSAPDPLQIQRDVLELIATGQSLDLVLHELVLSMERAHPGMRGSILVVEADGEHLHTAAAPNLPAEYQALVEQLACVGPCAGGCGTACFRRESVVAADIATDPLWASYTDIAQRFGLRACWSQPIFSRDGEVLGSFAMYYDQPRVPTVLELESLAVAARLAAIALDRARDDAALRRNQERLNLALAASNMGTWDWELAGDRVEWSDGVEGLFGLAKGSFERTFGAYLRLIPGDDQGRVRAAIDAVLFGDADDYAVEHAILWPDGSRHFLEGKGRVFRGADGAPTRMTGTVADVTARRRFEVALRESEELLRQSQKMEAIGRLAGGVAHDFNNLLTAIGGYCSLALLEFPNDDPRREYLEEIQRAGERGASLTKQLLASGRKQVLSRRLLDLNALVDDLTNLLRRVIGEDIELEWARGSAPAVVFADPGQVEQVIMNLAVNARDAMPGGGTLTIASSSVFVDGGAPRSPAQPPASYVLLTVADTGHGMDEETMARMFEPFFTTKDLGKGTGLGLSTVYGIVEQLSGFIRARSAPGQGTVFEIYLPERERSLLSPRPESVAPVVRGGSETVMLVEDEPQVRKLIDEVLRSRGYQVLSAKDGLEAIPLQENYAARIDLLITDVVMPGLGGRELANHVRAARPETKVLFLSGYTDDAVLRNGVTASGNGFLQKPFALEDLLHSVRALLDAQ